MEFIHVVGICLVGGIIYLFMTRNRGGVKDIGRGINKALYEHTSIIKDGVVYRPVSAEKTREPGMYRVVMREIENDGRLGEDLHFVLNEHDFQARSGLVLSPGELVLEEKISTFAELVDPVAARLRDEELIKFFEHLEYETLENQLKDAEAGKRDLLKTVSTTRKQMLGWFDLLKTLKRENVKIKGERDQLRGLLDAYGNAPETINNLVKAEATIRRLSNENAELRAGETAAAEATKSILGRSPDGGGHADTVVVSK